MVKIMRNACARRIKRADACYPGAEDCADPDPGGAGLFPCDSAGSGSGADSNGGGESGSDDLAGSLTLPEYVYATYNELMKNGWRMAEIDEMDMLRFLRLLAWDAQRESEKKKPRHAYIDEVWGSVKPG